MPSSQQVSNEDEQDHSEDVQDMVLINQKYKNDYNIIKDEINVSIELTMDNFESASALSTSEKEKVKNRLKNILLEQANRLLVAYRKSTKMEAPFHKEDDNVVTLPVDENLLKLNEIQRNLLKHSLNKNKQKQAEKAQFEIKVAIPEKLYALRGQNQRVPVDHIVKPLQQFSFDRNLQRLKKVEEMSKIAMMKVSEQWELTNKDFLFD